MPPSVFQPDSESFSIYTDCLIDGTGARPCIDILIKIDAGRISAVDRRINQNDLPGGTIDLTGSIVMPGLVDCHVHLLMSGTLDKNARKRQLEFTCAEAQNMISRHLAQQARYGVVALGDDGDYGGYVSRYKQEYDRCEKSGLVLSAAGKALHAAGAMADSWAGQCQLMKY